MNISKTDRKIIRELAKRVAEIAALPVMAERRDLWKRHNSLQPGRPLILVFPEGAWNELLPESVLQCANDTARAFERQLRVRIYAYEHFQDDSVITAEWPVGSSVENNGWGLETRRHNSDVTRGAWAFDPVLKDSGDLKKLHYPEARYDAAATLKRLEETKDIFGDILKVKSVGIQHISFHLMQLYTGWRGLAEAMMDMAVDPQMVHNTMAFLEEGHRRLIRQYEELNLLGLNNDNTYHSSGGNGFTDELPAPGADPNRVHPRDMWASAESQELAQVSPEMHREFALQYEKRLLAPFGLNGYGCCEDLTRKLADVFTIPNLRRISISPWANVDKCAAKIGSRLIFSWKPRPSDLCGAFAPERIRAYIRHTLETAREHNCILEIILKDTHTCENHPERFDEWTRIAQRLIREKAT